MHLEHTCSRIGPEGAHVFLFAEFVLIAAYAYRNEQHNVRNIQNQECQRRWEQPSGKDDGYIQIPHVLLKVGKIDLNTRIYGPIRSVLNCGDDGLIILAPW